MINAGADVNVVDDFEQTPLTNIATARRPEILQLLLAVGADVNFRPAEIEGHHIDALHRCKTYYECAKIIVASGKLKLDGRPKYEIDEYNQIKTKVQFEQKALADIEAIKTAYLECNKHSIENSFYLKIP